MISNGMKILIATPIHQMKDYCMERWLANVAKLQLKYPYDLILADNSLGMKYVEKVKDYCRKYGVRNYKIKHLELPPDRERFERIARSREIIRTEFLPSDYEAWFSWESDIIIPVNTLDKLVKIINSGDYLMVSHNNWTRQVPDIPNYDWGVALIKREALEKYSFILDFGTDPEMPDTWEPSEAWFRKRVLRDGGSFVEVYGVINPIYHLDK